MPEKEVKYSAVFRFETIPVGSLEPVIHEFSATDRNEAIEKARKYKEKLEKIYTTSRTVKVSHIKLSLSEIFYEE